MGPETETDQQAEDEAAAELDTAQIPDWETLPGLAAGRLIAAWLLVLCAMVFAMVVLGGVTRLTQSGLSMVDWRPLTGWLPPMGEAEWQAVFERYRQFPEYKELNYGMGLGEFKSIFWLEYAHRLWGRVIGLVFLLPLVFFALRGWIGRRLAPRLVVIFALGAGQGVLGWYMVQSGLVLEPDVSQYRLVAHLAAALLIHGYMFWVALSLLLMFGAKLAAAAAIWLTIPTVILGMAVRMKRQRAFLCSSTVFYAPSRNRPRKIGYISPPPVPKPPKNYAPRAGLSWNNLALIRIVKIL